jgi:HEAT repeat protein
MRITLCPLLIWALILTVPALGAETKNSKKVQALLKDLQSSSPKRRLYAVEEIGHIAELRLKDAQPAIPNVLKALKDANPGVRRAAMLALVKMEADPKETVPAYIEIIQKDTNQTVRQAAVTALGQIGPPARAAAPILKDLQLKVQKEQPPKDKKPAKDKSKQFFANQTMLREIAMALQSIQSK